MGDTYLHLLYEQTSPLEVVMFVLLTALVFTAIAALIYMAIMLVLWRLRLRESVKLSRLFFPKREQLRENLGDYLLAAVTALVFTLTLGVKHQLIEDVHDAQLEMFDKHKVEQLMPLHTTPPDIPLAEGIAAYQLLKPAVMSGRSDEAQIVARQILEEMLSDEDEGSYSARIARVLSRASTLVGLASVLIVAYLAWLARGRFKKFKKDPEGGGAPGYQTTARKIFTLSICVGLLLATPAVLSNTDRLAEAAVASIRAHAPAGDDAVEEDPIGKAFHRQFARLSLLEPEVEGTDSLWGQLASIDLLAKGNRECCTEVRSGLDASIAEFDQLRTDLTRLTASVGRVENRLASLASDHGRLDDAHDTDIVGVRDDVARAEAGVVGLQADLETIATSLEGLAGDLLDHDGRLTAQDTRVTDNASGLTDARNELRAVEDSIGTVQTGLGNLRTDVGGPLRDHDARIATLERAAEAEREPDTSVAELDQRLRAELGDVRDSLLQLEGIHRTGVLIVHSEIPGDQFTVSALAQPPSARVPGGPSALEQQQLPRQQPLVKSQRAQVVARQRAAPAVLTLAPGQYSVTGRSGTSQSVTVHEGSVTGVLLLRGNTVR